MIFPFTNTNLIGKICSRTLFYPFPCNVLKGSLETHSYLPVYKLEYYFLFKNVKWLSTFFTLYDGIQCLYMWQILYNFLLYKTWNYSQIREAEIKDYNSVPTYFGLHRTHRLGELCSAAGRPAPLPSQSVPSKLIISCVIIIHTE